MSECRNQVPNVCIEPRKGVDLYIVCCGWLNLNGSC